VGNDDVAPSRPRHPRSDGHRCTADVIRAGAELLHGDDDPPQHAFAMEALLEGAGVIMLSSRALAKVLAISWSPGNQ